MQPLHPILLKVPTSLNSKQIFLGFSKMPEAWKQEDIPCLYAQRKDTYAFLFLLINTLKSISTQQEHSVCAQIIKQGAIFSLKSGFFCLFGFLQTQQKSKLWKKPCIWESSWIAALKHSHIFQSTTKCSLRIGSICLPKNTDQNNMLS